MKIKRAPSLLLALVGLSAGLAFGQTAPDPLDACAKEKDDAARLACFDRQMAARHQQAGAQVGGAAQPPSQPSAVRAPQAPAAVSAPLASAPHDQAVSAPPATPSHGQNAASPSQAIQSRTPPPVSATVARLVRVSRDEYAFQLDNGQIWQQTDSRQDLRVRVNDRVTINPGTFGDFFFTTPGRQHVRVKRIR